MNDYLQPYRGYRGVNLGGFLEAPNEGDWSDGIKLTYQHFHLVQKAGFNLVRVPIRWSGHAQLSAPYRIESEFFDRIDWVINQVLSQHLAIVINIHNYEELMRDPVSQKERFLSYFSVW